MKKNTKSSITLPPQELAVVNSLMRKIKAKSKVEVIRRALELLRSSTEKAELREQYRVASEMTADESMKVISETESANFERLDQYEVHRLTEQNPVKTRGRK